MSKSFVKRLLLGFIVIVQSQPAPATGNYGPAPRWLENGGIAIDQSPEFFWETMLRERAKSFLPAEKRVVFQNEQSQDDLSKQYAEQTKKADTAEFHEAITKGVIKPADAQAAEEAHAERRGIPDASVAGATAASGSPPSPEFDSEFSDYHRGVLAMNSNEPGEAGAIWKKLLERP